MTILSLPKQDYNLKPCAKWLEKDKTSDKFFVYVLKISNGRFYIGQTRELLERLMEHKEGISRSTSKENPKLRYFEILHNRQEAMSREHYLKQLLYHNRRELIRIITEFHSFIKRVELD